jgi:hypothetical protein
MESWTWMTSRNFEGLSQQLRIWTGKMSMKLLKQINKLSESHSRKVKCGLVDINEIIAG